MAVRCVDPVCLLQRPQSRAGYADLAIANDDTIAAQEDESLLESVQP